MKILSSILTFILIAIPTWVLAQNIEIKGKVTDSENIALPGVNIQVKGTDAGTLSDLEGNYSVNTLKGAVLIFLLVGMATQEKEVSESAILNVSLKDDATELEEVTITLKKPVIVADKGKLTFNVSNNAANSGVSAFDLLKKIPGIGVSQNDDISLRGSGVNVMIDGKMSFISGNQLGIYLKGLNADDIRKIELITNPSAAFDASGNTGLINIVTKKNKSKGYALSLRSGISKGTFWMNNQNISASINEEKWSVYGSFDYNTPHRERNSTSGNSIIENGERINLERSNTIPFQIYYYTYKVGGNWNFSPRHTLGMHYHGYLDDFSGTKTSDILKKKEDGTLLSKVYSTYELKEPYHYDAYNLDYQFLIDSMGKKITADARYISYRNYSDAVMIGTHTGANGNTLFINNIRTHQPGSIKIKSAQIDAELPFEGINMKTGLKFAEVTNDNNFHSEELINGEYLPIPSMNDHFKYKEQISAVYGSASKSFGKTSIDLGLRVEHTSSNSSLIDTQFNRKNEYTRFFPNLSVGHQFENDNKLNVSISRRINRPAYSELNPVRWYNDEYFYFDGNPDLVPEMAWLSSASYVIANKYIFTAEYGKRSNYISRSLSYDPNGVTIRSQSTNFENFERLDLTVITPLKVITNWDIQLMTGANYTKYPISESGVENNIKRWAALVSLQQQIKFLKHYSADISLKYTSQELRGVYLTNDIFFMDFGVKRSFFNNKLDVAISLNDAFNTYREKGYSKSHLTNYHYNDKPDSRRFGITLRYNFGGDLINNNKKKSEEQERL
ncbi:hypothetical protein KO02_21905 [Sphingobacterium sp. ML3W]|uniref:outer membrane beta-barrel family protein n=1 Tax=Sphingobacterium sp. ML3W TaxID=1538644 RepID=UPI0004F8B833|nr:outer membrane beta-barrel family protein [Sphingobacterium sp. ML3W]AIM39042.1 hypothetical protein KO02_21905 [Sphingobacterium sp. ML3W]